MKIEAKNLVKIYGDRTVVNDISFEVNKGEVVGLLGPNGAGKTTTFYMVVGLVKPNGGQVFLGDKDLTNVPMNVRAKEGIGYLPQEASIFRKLSVEDNIKLVLEMNDKLTPDEKKEKLEDLLSEFGMTRHRKSSAVALSGGEHPADLCCRREKTGLHGTERSDFPVFQRPGKRDGICLHHPGSRKALHQPAGAAAIRFSHHTGGKLLRRGSRREKRKPLHQ